MTLPLFMRILDILAAAGTILCLNLVMKTYKAWFWYIFASIMFTAVCWYSHLVGQTVMGFVLIGTGIRNFTVGRRKFYAKEKG